MIDLHAHILPGIDDGADSLATALAMARIAVASGTTVMACTPHIYPGLYMNDAAGIRRERDKLQATLDRLGIALRLTLGADAHLVPELLDGLRSGRVPTLAGSRYFLLEPPHHAAPPGFEQRVLEIVRAGYLPVITHPERLGWIEHHYPRFTALARAGCWLQLTAGSIVGRFGQRARYWSERLLDDGMVHLVASDAHGTGRRSPDMACAVPLLERRVGVDETRLLLQGRPQAVLDDRPPDQVAPPPGLSGAAGPPAAQPAGGLARLGRLLSRG